MSTTPIASTGLLALAGLHVVWATGSPWPMKDEAGLVNTVTGRSGGPAPGPGACLAVAGALASAAALVSGRPRRPSWLSRIGSSVVVGAFTVRGAFGLAGRTDLLVAGSTSEAFRSRDRQLFGPICLTLAALSAPACGGNTRRRMAAPIVTPLLDRLVNHPWLIGDPTTPGRRLGKRVRWLTATAIVLANLGGAAVVICFALFVLPKPDGVFDPEVYWSNLALALAYLTVAIAVGVGWGRRLVEAGRGGVRSWLEEDREPTPDEQLRVLRAPLRIMFVEAVLWGIAVLAFSALNAVFSPLLALGVGLTVALGGITTSSVAYLLTELALRPVASRALASGAPDRRGLPGVTARWLLAWALGTGAPIVGLGLVGIVALTSVEIDESTLAVTAVTLCGIALFFGALASLLAAYATVHPIGSIRRGLADVQRGDFDVRLGVWDSTEIGLLQAGFNEMVGGLRERERIRDLFGRQVGQQVAQQALAGGDVDLGGVECDVAVLFVDVVGSTELAATNSPRHVVDLLNRFFGEVVDVVERNGGWINKFEGDAALAIFGAPGRLDDAEGRALSAARELDQRLRARVPELAAGIGVASGPVVAGHIGAEQRFEYTVIGDPVNEAARLTELAKGHASRVLASSATVQRANDGEAARWELGEPVVLRGRGAPTVLATPRSATG